MLKNVNQEGTEVMRSGILVNVPSQSTPLKRTSVKTSHHV